MLMVTSVRSDAFTVIGRDRCTIPHSGDGASGALMPGCVPSSHGLGRTVGGFHEQRIEELKEQIRHTLVTVACSDTSGAHRLDRLIQGLTPLYDALFAIQEEISEE